VTSSQEDANAPLTLAFDIGGSYLKAEILSPDGALLKGPNRVATPHPTHPQDVVEALVAAGQGSW
jgi:polyphosphate glucokinase